MISLTSRIPGFWLYILRAASLISDVAVFQALVMFHTFGCLYILPVATLQWTYLF